jgi:hypothetical protein
MFSMESNVDVELEEKIAIELQIGEWSEMGANELKNEVETQQFTPPQEVKKGSDSTSSSDCSSQSDSDSDSEPEIDYFHYPTDSGLADSFGLPNAKSWRHNLSGLCKLNDGSVYRLTIKGAQFPGRCFHCKKNNKSLVFCFIGQEASGACFEHMSPALQNRINDIKVIQEHWSKTNVSQKEETTFDFPNPEEIEEPRNLSRVSEHHYFPPIINLLCQKPYKKYFSPELFDSLLSKRITATYSLKNKERVGSLSHSKSWTECQGSFDTRKEEIRERNAMTTDREKRKRTDTLLSKLYGTMHWAACSQTCSVPSKKCPSCISVRKVLKKQYLAAITDVVFKRIVVLFNAREGPFARFTTEEFASKHYEDNLCEVFNITIRGREV